MKKKALVLMLLVLLFPMFVKAGEIVENDAKIKYTIDESMWTREDSSDPNEKVWRNDCGVISVMTKDMYVVESFDLTRELHNYKNIFYREDFFEDFNKFGINMILGDKVEHKNFKVGYLYVTSERIDPLQGTIVEDFYLTEINGYATYFSYIRLKNNDSSTCLDSFNKVVETAEATVRVKEEVSLGKLFINILIAIVCFMAYPFIRVKFMNVTYRVDNYKKMALFNAAIVTAIAIVLQLAIAGGHIHKDIWPWISVLPVILYFVNRWAWFEKDHKNVNGDMVPVFKNEDKLFRTEKSTVKLFKCDNCGALVSEFETKCPACGEVFEDEEEVKEEPKKKESKKETKKEEKTKKYKCDNCGALVDEDATKCPYCGESFDDDEEVKEEPKKQEKKTKMVFKCDNCGALVPEDATECPNCGESFEDEEEVIPEPVKDEEKAEPKKKEVEVKEEVSVDQKYSDLKKLKELLDNDIITKAEFDKEKKKILK